MSGGYSSTPTVPQVMGAGGLNIANIPMAVSVGPLDYVIVMQATGMAATPTQLRLAQISQLIAGLFINGTLINSGTGVPGNATPGAGKSSSMWLRTDGTLGARVYVAVGDGQTWNAIAGV